MRASLSELLQFFVLFSFGFGWMDGFGWMGFGWFGVILCLALYHHTSTMNTIVLPMY